MRSLVQVTLFHVVFSFVHLFRKTTQPKIKIIKKKALAGLLMPSSRANSYVHLYAPRLLVGFVTGQATVAVAAARTDVFTLEPTHAAEPQAQWVLGRRRQHQHGVARGRGVIVKQVHEGLARRQDPPRGRRRPAAAGVQVPARAAGGRRR